LALNFRLAVNMLQLIYAYKNTTIDGLQCLPSPGFHLNARYQRNKINIKIKSTNNLKVNRTKNVGFGYNVDLLFFIKTLLHLEHNTVN
jgi:hypothetical protein